MATITPPLDNKERKSSICFAILQLRSFSRAFRCSRLFASIVVFFPPAAAAAPPPRLPADISGFGAPVFCALALIGLNDVAGVADDVWWAVALAVTAAASALALSVPDDPVKDETGCWESSVLATATALGC